ncbi:MAG: hypothetical protein K0U45_09180 [Alphaproteobacteria bacterium]|nr:hypothetical protein [Alphaproteobacteria bacterium]
MRPDAGKDKNADKLANIVSALASSDTKSPNSAMPPPDLLEEFGRIDESFPEFFKEEYMKQLRHERITEKKLVSSYLMIRMMDYGLPLFCIIALAITVFFGDSFIEKTLLGLMIIAIYLLRMFRDHIMAMINKDKAKQPSKKQSAT